MSQQHPDADFLIGAFGVNLSHGRVYGGTVPLVGPDVVRTSVPVEFLAAVVDEVTALREQIRLLNQELDAAYEPRPLEQALAVLAQAWQSAVKPVEPERVAMPDVLLEAQRAGWDASSAAVGTVPVNPWPVGTPLYYEWHNGALMETNDEARP